jgi:hypothetical protein
LVITAPPDLPSLVAVIVAVQAATAVMMPAAVTVATLGFDEVHRTTSRGAF